MAYYVRSDAPSGRYIRTDVSDGRYLAHSAKGTEWSKGHKYIDKRWIQGAWEYLYEIPKEYAERAGNAVKDTAKKATDAVKETAKNVKATAEKKVEETKKAAKDFKDYSKNVDKKWDNAVDTYHERGDGGGRDNRTGMQTSIDKRRNDAIASKTEAEKEKAKAEKDIENIHERWHNGEVVNQKEVQDAHNRLDAANKAIEKADKDIKNADEATARNEKAREEARKVAEEASKEAETAKYKASKALNDVIDGTTGATKQAAQWLKNQLNSGADWTTDQIEKIRESDAVASLAGKLENLYANSNSGATKKGLSILSQIIGWGKLEAPKKSSKTSSSGRTYSGTGTKAQRREAVDGGPVSNNDYSNRPKKRR